MRIAYLLFIKHLIFSILIICLFSQISIADVVVLKNGERIKGAISNRDQVAKEPWKYEIVSILPDNSLNLIRINVSDLDYLILIDGDARNIIDFTQYKEFRKNIIDKERKGLSNKSNGIGLLIFGTVALATGSLIKFGGAKATFSESGVDVEEHSYNEINYILIGIGAVTLILGLVLIDISDKTDNNAFIELNNNIKMAGLKFNF